MRMSKMFVPTRKEDPADAEVISHKLLVRGGYIRMLARGIYTYLPLAWRSIRKIEEIIREEMDRAGAQEVLMPAVQPAELWQESKRWEQYGPELLRFKDRKGSDYVVGPTHEEVITDIVRGDVTSYKQLPLNLYQIQAKFRDEVRPRFGLMRGREFVMKDAYSFDIDDAGAQASYDTMYAAYQRICERMGFEFRAVEADTGNIGGSRSHEFQVLAETGEDEIVSCKACEYAANVEKAEIKLQQSERSADTHLESMQPVETPGARTIEEVSAFLKRQPAEFVKTLIYMAGEEPIAVLVRGDHAANELKLRAYLNEQTELDGSDLRLASDAEVAKITRAPVGFAGPIGLKIPTYADLAVRPMANFIVGANAKDKHVQHVNHGVDFDVTTFADLRQAHAGDVCGRCGEGRFTSHRGIEVGHIFYLGTKYSEAMGAEVQDEDGQLKPMIMGCYGMGVTRVLAAVVEQNNDADGIIWPMALAPYHAIILPLQMNNDEVVAAAQRIYEELKEAGVEVILDDRDARAGAKFKDADLIGVPLRITIGSRGLNEGNVEFKVRGGGEVEHVGVDEVAAKVAGIVGKELGR